MIRRHDADGNVPTLIRVNRGTMARTAALALIRLESLYDVYEGGAAATKLNLLQRLDRGRLSRPSAVLRLHEVL